MGKAPRFEDHFDLKTASARCCLSERKLWQAIQDKEIDPVVEIPGPKRANAKTLIPASSLAKYLARFLVVRNPAAG